MKDNQMINIPITFETLLKVVDSLSLEQKCLLRQHLEIDTSNDEIDLSKPRVFGLHMDAMMTSDNFDEPLPDKFWLGEDVDSHK